MTPRRRSSTTSSWRCYRAARRAADAPPSVAADPEAADPEVAPTLDPEPSAPRQLGERLFEADPAARARVHAAAEEPERATGADDEAGDDGTSNVRVLR